MNLCFHFEQITKSTWGLAYQNIATLRLWTKWNGLAGDPPAVKVSESARNSQTLLKFVLCDRFLQDWKNSYQFMVIGRRGASPGAVNVSRGSVGLINKLSCEQRLTLAPGQSLPGRRITLWPEIMWTYLTFWRINNSLTRDHVNIPSFDHQISRLLVFRYWSYREFGYARFWEVRPFQG